MRRRPTTLLPLLASLLATPAAAKDRVLLVDISSPRIAAPLREQVLVGLVTGLGDGGLEPRRPPRDAGVALGKKIDGMRGEAKQLAQRFKEQEALERLRRAEAAYRAGAGRLTSVEPLIAILLDRAKLEVDTGKAAEVRQTLRRLAVLDPELTLDPGRFVPQLVRALAGLRKKAARRQGQLRVTSTPSGLPVWIDGEPDDTATTPAELTLIAGEHLVSAGSRHSARSQLVTVEQDSDASVRLTFAEPDDNQLRAVGREASAAWVVAVKVNAQGGKHRVTLRVISARTVKVAREVSSEPFAAGQSTWALSKLSLTALPLLGGAALDDKRPPPSTPPPVTDDDDSLLKKWWFWTAVGVAVAAGGGVTAAVLLTGDRSVRLRLVP